MSRERAETSAQSPPGNPAGIKPTALTAQQYRELSKRPSDISPSRLIPRTQEHGGKGIADRLRAMGHYFELDPKEVKFYVRQLELSKIIAEE